MEVSPGRRLGVQGAPVRQVTVLVDGTAVIDADGQPIGTLRSGAVVGWPEVLTAAPAPATVTAVTRCRVLVLDRREWNDLCGRAGSSPVDAEAVRRTIGLIQHGEKPSEGSRP